MQRNTIIGTIAVLAIVAAVISMFFTRSGSDYNSSFKPSGALGKVLADETANLLNQRGRIVIIEWDLKPDQLPRSSEQVKSFKEALKKKNGISIAQSHLISAEGPAMMVLGSALPAKEFSQVVQKYPDADAIVSFVGSPVLSPKEVEQFKTFRPKLLIVDVTSIEKVARPNGVGIEKLIEAGIIDMAVVSTTGDTANARGRSTPRGGNFDPYFKILSTQDN